jgi:hypothetical protein
VYPGPGHAPGPFPPGPRFNPYPQRGRRGRGKRRGQAPKQTFYNCVINNK